MRVSIVNAVLDSPEVVRRHVLHYQKIGLPDDVEWIIVDDGSEPPLPENDMYRLFQTNDKRAWTQPTARNIGVKHTKGEYLILTDIDHIISRDVIELARSTDADLIRFKRYAGVLDKNGDFTQDWDVLKQYGLKEKYRDSLRLSPHSNSFIIKKDVYINYGMVSERFVGTGAYPNREEIPFKNRINKAIGAGDVKYAGDDNRPSIYMIPNGRYCGDADYNPFGLFHTLNRLGRRHLRHAK